MSSSQPAGVGALQSELVIRDARPEEFEKLGLMMVSVYSSLEGFPKQDEQPAYYAMLLNIGQLAQKPNTRLLVAVAEGEVIGGVVYFSDMAQYGSGGIAGQETNASGFRLLAVSPAARGKGIGKALVERCIELATEQRHAQLIIHSTAAMGTAWKMYKARGFERSPELDFMQGALQVYGFRLKL